MSEFINPGVFWLVETASGLQIKNEIGFNDILVSNLLPTRRINNSGMNF